MAVRSRTPPLGEFELLVLLAAMSLGDNAYPLAVTRNIEERTGRKVSRAAVLITLTRMEDKDLVRSSYGDPTPERGGRPKRFFQVKARGVQAVQDSLDRIGTMVVGLESVLKRR
jgi:PadR family transcriptional regulator PadR